MQPELPEDRIDALANILSLVAILGRMDKKAIQRVLISLGSSLMGLPDTVPIDREVARKLFAGIASEMDEAAMAALAGDLNLIAKAWQPVLDEYLARDPYQLMPFAEIVFQLINYSGNLLHTYDAFERFGGPDGVLPLSQLSSALTVHAVPVAGLKWELVGFADPPDHALLASNESLLYLFKAASSGIDARFSELARNADEGARREYDVRIDATIFASFVAGLLGDMLYYAARLRSHALPGQEMWQRIQALLTLPPDPTLPLSTPRSGKP